MSSLDIPGLAVSTFTKGLETYSHILKKTQEYAKEKGLDVNSFVQARLIEDQLPFAFQVQNATKAVQIALGRLSGEEPTLFTNNETSFSDLGKRIAKTLELVRTFDVVKATGRDLDTIDFPWGGQTHKITVKDALLTQSIPNFYFHLTTGYSILRAKGVPLGKADFLGNFLGL